MKLSKLTAFLLALSLCIPFCIPFISAFAEEQEVTVVELSNRSVIEGAGLPASSLYSKSGDYTAKLAGNDLKKNFKFNCRKDWTGYDTVKLWVYSPVELVTPVTFILNSDNPATTGRDYYFATAEIGQLGWNVVYLPYAGDWPMFYAEGSPLGYDKITSFEIWTDFDGYKADANAQLYLDDITIMTLKDEEKEAISNNRPSGGSNKGNGSSLPAKVELYGEFVLGSNNKMLPAPAISDWTGYNTLVIKMKNDKPSKRPFGMWVESQNPATVSNDYWMFYVDFQWTGEKELAIDLTDGKGGGSGTPLGWDQITGMRFSPYTYQWMEDDYLDEDVTEVVVESIYLTNVDYKEKLYGENSGNYIYPAQTKEDYYDYAADMRAKNTSHPRIFVDAEYLEEMKSLLTTDMYLNSCLNSLRSTVNQQMAKATLPTDPSYAAQGALLYNLTGEEKYAEWVWKCMEEQSINAGSWCPPGATYLTVGGRLRDVAITYDLMYNHWTEEQRKIVRNSIMHNGIEYVIHTLRTHASWAGNHTNNLTQVMMSGTGIAALALFDDPEYDPIVNELLNEVMTAFRYTQSKTIDETGGYREGLSYWIYGMGHFIPFAGAMWEILDVTELLDCPGMDRTGMYPIGLTGPTAYYNFGDANLSSSTLSHTYFVLSRYFDDPAYGAFQINNGGKDWLSMMLYRPDKRYEEFEKYMPTSVYFPDANQVLAVRRSWVDKNAAFLGIKAGSNTGGSHTQLDVGTYCFDMLGVRWAWELGTDDYTAQYNYEDGRYVLYRNRIEGQNGLLINPDGKVDQNFDVDCNIDEYKVTDNAAYAIMDITEAYEGRGVSSVKRGFAMLNNFGSLLIQDEIQSAAPIEAYTFMHTKAKIEIAEDGKSAILSQDGKKLRAILMSPAEGTFLDMPAEPLPQSPHPVEAKDNSMYRKLAVHVKDVKSPTISMLITPYQEDEANEYRLEKVTPIRMFRNYLRYPVTVKNLYLDGVPINGFESAVSNYVLNEHSVGTITADATSDVEVTVKQANEIGDTAFVIARSKKTGNKAVYTVTFSQQIQQQMDVSTYSPKSMFVSTGELSSSALIDGDVSTAWGSPSADWVAFDLGRPKELREMKVVWSQGSARYAFFDIEVSNDKENWTKVYPDGKSYMTDEYESYTFDPVTARYIRLYGKGNTSNSWVTVCEIRVTAYEDKFVDLADHWAKRDVENLANLNLIAVPEDEKFNPEGTITRAEFLELLQSVSGFSSMTYKGTFSDVSATSSYAECIEGAYALGFIPAEMIADGKFKSDQPITGEEMMTLSVLVTNKLLGLSKQEVSLDDYVQKANISAWCVNYMKNAMALRFLGGNLEENGFVPNANATRAQAAALAKRVFIKLY